MVTAELGACEWFVCELRRSNLIDRGQLDQIVGEFLKRNQQADPKALAEHLIQQSVLTPFQAERVLANKAQGLVLGPYALTDALGAGSMGTVYKAVSKSDNRLYAIKILPRRSMWNVRLARRQVRAFGQFSHSAVVPFVDVGTCGGTHYLVWPLVEGEPLDKVVERMGRLTPAQTAQVGVQVASAMAACHAQNIFHGLLKPSNIMVGPDFRVAILDFGIGSLLAENEGESLVDTMSTANTLTNGLDCTSPESIMEPTNRTPAGDQYSLGCILYFCAAGRYPFADGSAVEKMVAHQLHQPKPLKELAPTVPEEMVAVIDRLLQKKPENRFHGADEVAERLLALAGPASVAGLCDANQETKPSSPVSAPSSPGIRRGSFTLPPPPRVGRPSSLIVPPAPSSASRLSGTFAAVAPPTPTPLPARHSSISFPTPPVAPPAPLPIRLRQSNPGPQSQFVMPPGFVPERPRTQFGPLAVAAVGLGAMILSYLTFMTINPFK